MRITHFVVKHNDLPKDSKTSNALKHLGYISRVNRTMSGKEAEPKYIVINMDEPYIDEIIAVLKKHKNWG